MVRFLALPLLAAVVLISGCARTQEIFSNDAPQLVAAPDKVSSMLADAADRSSKALESLAAVEQARGPGVSTGPVDGAPTELRRAVTVSWVGPVEPITKALADRASYNFQTVGTAPPIALVINLDVENKPLVEVLRDIGLQLGMRADIAIDTDHRMIEIHYAPNTGVGG